LAEDDSGLYVFKIDAASGEFEGDHTAGILGLAPATKFGESDWSGWNIMYQLKK